MFKIPTFGGGNTNTNNIPIIPPGNGGGGGKGNNNSDKGDDKGGKDDKSSKESFQGFDPRGFERAAQASKELELFPRHHLRQTLHPHRRHRL